MPTTLCIIAIWVGFASTAAVADIELSRESRWILLHAETVISESRVPPINADWQPITLPDSWRLTDRYLEGTSAWYRFRVPHTKPAEPYALYLWRFSMNIEAYFNDELIGSGGSFEEPIARNWNRPFLFRVPNSAWRQGQNWIYVHLRVYPGWGTFTPPAFGPVELLEPAYESRYFYQITLAQYSFVVTIVVAILGLVFWGVDWRDRTYLFFAAASSAWTIYSLNLFIQDISVPAKAWWWLVHTSIDVFVLLLVCFSHRLLGVRRPRLELTMATMVAAGSCLYAVWDLPTLARLANVVHGLMLLCSVYLVAWIVWVAVRRRSREAIILGAALAVVQLLGFHDLFLNSLVVPELWATQFLLAQFGAPIFLLMLIIHLALRLMSAITETRTANLRLEHRVQEVTAALEGSFAKQTELERERAATEERHRIYQDLHDDVGARLLSLVYAAGEGKAAQLARDSLTAIRSIVSSDRIEGGLLAEIAADWRVEVEGRCAAAGFELDWSDDVDRSVRLSGLQRYHVDNAIRELVSNALEHSGGRRIVVRLTAHGAGDILFQLDDDGRGLGDSHSVNGSGLTGIRRRVAQLGGVATWRHSTMLGGASCVLRIPIHPNGG